MSEQVTRCPSCDTSFVVSEAQLSAADGAVRCGACLEVFIAADFFLEAPIADLFEGQLDSVAAEIDIDAEEQVVFVDNEGEAEQDTDSENEVPEDEDDTTEEESSEALEEVENNQNDEEEIPSLVAEVTELEADPDFDEESPEAEQNELHPSGIDSEQLDQALQQITDEPVDSFVPEFSETKKSTAGRWFLVSLVLFTTLSGQYFWFEREFYSAQIEYRPYYEKVCNALGCELTPFSDVAFLNTNNLVVRTHPTQESVLIVDALLRNEAAFRQPFPGLYLRFADVMGGTVAERTFLPKTYLAGEMAGLRYIPASTEVRLSLEIIDPGEDAVGYSLVAVARP